MKDGPDIARLGALIGDPARANMLTALMSGKALTASELAAEAGVTLQTASAHIARLQDGGFIRQRKQGRHRYIALADADVAHVLETLMGLAQKRGHTRVRTGPRDADLRKARVCYNHLAGDLGVHLFDSCVARGLISENGDEVALTKHGRVQFSDFGVAFDALEKSRRPLCRPCLDWSARRSHLAGSLGVALLDRMYDLGWARKSPDSRVVSFTRTGEKRFLEAFPLKGE
jgi:DNA-binding transcriptional ArsR family regulator